MQRTLVSKIVFLVVTFLSLTLSVATAQTSRTHYFSEIPAMRHQSNPAFMPERGYLALPILGGSGVDLLTNSFYLDHFLFHRRDGELTTFLDPEVDSDAFVGRLKEENRLSQQLHTNLLGFGFHDKRGAFWTIGLNAREMAYASIPKGMFELIKLGPDHYSEINDISLSTEAYLEGYLGYARKINDRVQIGVKGKMLVGLARANLNISRFDVVSNDDILMADVRTTLDLNLKGLEQTSPDKLHFDDYLSSLALDKKQLGFAGIGLALDLGVVYKPIDRLTLSASVLDLGFSYWSKGSSVHGASDGLVDFFGFDIDVDDDTSVDDQWTELENRFNEMLQYQREESQSLTRMLYAKIHLAASYEILPGKLNAGLLYEHQVSQKFPVQQLSATVNYRPFHFVEASLSTTMLNGAFRSAGFGLSLQAPKAITFTVGGDYLFTRYSKQLYPIHSGGFNLYAGVTFPIFR